MCMAMSNLTASLRERDPSFAFEFMQRVRRGVGQSQSLLHHGTYVVLRKPSFIGDGLRTRRLPIVIAYLGGFNLNPGGGSYGGTGLGIGSSIAGRVSPDTAIGVLFTGAFALDFLMSRSPCPDVDL